ncbi:MAG: IS4 family transposase, partial [Cyanobacteria bacterium J06635_13]
MNQINLLRQTLKPHLGWHGARLSFLALFLIALLRVKTINLTELATGFRSQAQTDSSYKRLQRFFRDFDLDYTVIAKAIVGIMGIPQPWVLSTDRTEWSFGATRFNILLLGVVHEGVAYPVVWKMLEKKGNSNGDERMDLLDRFHELSVASQVSYLSIRKYFVE